MPFSTVLFDLDGTLIDSNHLIITTFQYTLREQLGLEVSETELKQYFGEALPETLGRYSPERALELTEFYRVYNSANHDQLMRQFEGVRETVEHLHERGVKLAVVTSKKTELARRGLAVTGLTPYFPVVVGMDLTERPKPDAQPALLALTRLDVEPGSHVLMVGDSKFDIQCGRNAGLKTAAVRWSVQTPEALAAFLPDYWVDRPQDLIQLVLGD